MNWQWTPLPKTLIYTVPYSQSVHVANLHHVNTETYGRQLTPLCIVICSNGVLIILQEVRDKTYIKKNSSCGARNCPCGHKRE